MEFLQITSHEDYRVEEIFNSYTTTFPEDERRDWNKFSALFTNPKVKVLSVLQDAQNVGYLIIWEMTNYVFVEHFEVFKAFRSQNFGSRITEHLFSEHPRIILEIEHETYNDDAKRRYSFYKKNGFKLIDEMYVQPSYGEGKKPLELWLLANYQPENLNEIKDEIYDIVYH